MSDHTPYRRSRASIRPELTDLSDAQQIATIRARRGPAISVRVAFEQFSQSRELDGRRARTVAAYADFLRLCADWLEREQHVTDIWDLQPQHIERYLLWLRQAPSLRTGRRLSVYSVRSYTTRLITTLTWLEARGVLPPHTTAGLHVPSIPTGERKVPQTATDEEVERLFAACASDGQGYGEQLALTIRNRALLSVLLDTGVRLSEAWSMRVERLDWEHLSLQVLESKTTLRAVGFGASRTAEYLRRYVLRGGRHTLAYDADGVPYDAAITDGEGPLWLNRDGVPLTPSGIEQVFKRIRKRAEVTSQFSPHTCRRYYITRAIQAGVPIPDIARQCGVSIEVIMQHYYSATETERIQKVRVGSPLDRLAREAALKRGRGRRTGASLPYNGE